MERAIIEELFYGKPDQQRRFTQDFPVLPDVWMEYAAKPKSRFELLLTPHNRSDAPTLARALRERLKAERAVAIDGQNAWEREHSKGDRPRILFNESVVLADFSFWETMRVAMPLTDWWKRAIAPIEGPWTRENLIAFVTSADNYRTGANKTAPIGDPKLIKKLISIVGAIERDRQDKPVPVESLDGENLSPEQIDGFASLLRDLTHPQENRGLLWSVSRNRPAGTSIWRSRNAVKADAAARLFAVKTGGIRWAVLDTGVDATHPGFARRDEPGGKQALEMDEDDEGHPQYATRVVKTYDFMRLKDLLDPETGIALDNTAASRMEADKLKDVREDLQRALERGRAIDWDLIEPFLRIPHDDEHYVHPSISHGTHVAGIIAADWPEAANETALGQPVQGLCPDLEIYDLRVLGPGADEFTIIAALQFIRHLNAHKDLMMIHGVNLSMSVPHDVANYACGRTPVCEECERVVGAGVVVVTAAGNRGFNKLAAPEGGATGDYRFISITDPGNADSVITVGSTHRYMPHNYGVSYFSSRGPTGDGRTKPDLVAPGERIDSCSLSNDYETMDGTSMAAPHVSGAAALLMARHRELIGQPKRLKEILCRSATDLGREPRFQGAGMLDVLRALQSV
jgi:serine protease AprX